MKNLPTRRNDSSFAVQFSNSVLKTRAILLFTIKIIEMFELHTSMPPMRSAEYQATIPLKFLIIIHNYTNIQTIIQHTCQPPEYKNLETSRNRCIEKISFSTMSEYSSKITQRLSECSRRLSIRTGTYLTLCYCSHRCSVILKFYMSF